MEWLNFRVKVFLILIICVVICGTVGFSILEGLSNFDSVYLTIITIATVGYGDLYPVTNAGRILAIFLILGGTGSFLGLLATVTELFIDRKEINERLQRINTVVGIFFREIGYELINSLSCLEADGSKTKGRLSSITGWSGRDFAQAKNDIKKMDIRLNAKNADIKHIENLISKKRDTLYRFLENPNLSEHETFTDLLHSLFHVSEEFEERKATKREVYDHHILEDIQEAYVLLINEWIEYMLYLKTNYPHFFSFAAETSPLCDRHEHMMQRPAAA